MIDFNRGARLSRLSTIIHREEVAAPVLRDKKFITRILKNHVLDIHFATVLYNFFTSWAPKGKNFSITLLGAVEVVSK